MLGAGLGEHVSKFRRLQRLKVFETLKLCHLKLCRSEARNGMAFRFGSTTRAYLAHAEAEDRKLRKDPNGGPCFEGTLQKPTSCFRIKSRGRDDLRTLHSLKT